MGAYRTAFCSATPSRRDPIEELAPDLPGREISCYTSATVDHVKENASRNFARTTDGLGSHVTGVPLGGGSKRNNDDLHSCGEHASLLASPHTVPEFPARYLVLKLCDPCHHRCFGAMATVYVIQDGRRTGS